MRKVVSCEIPDELNSRLENIAKFEERSRSFLIRKAVIAYVEQWEKENGDDILSGLIMGNALSNAGIK